VTKYVLNINVPSVGIIKKCLMYKKARNGKLENNLRLFGNMQNYK